MTIFMQNVMALFLAFQFCLSSSSSVLALSPRSVGRFSTSSSKAASLAPIVEDTNTKTGNAEMTKVESAAVQRFKRYDKLCKTCPTLLQPKVSTLEEMIMGLSATERDELLSNVSRRIEQERNNLPAHEAEGQQGEGPVRTARDVYQFQTGQAVFEATDTIMSPTEERIKIKEHQHKKEPSAKKTKLIEKMNKTRNKFERNKLGLERMQKLIDYTEMLLSITNTKETTTTTISNGINAEEMRSATSDPEIYHKMDELQTMSRNELKMQRLKFVAQKMKHIQKIAKGRMKLYGASLKLARQENK